MSGLTNISFLREYHGFSDRQPTDTLIENRRFNAEDTLREWVSDTSYDEAVATLNEVPETTEPKALRKARAFRNAEAELLMYCLLLSLNVKVGDQGIVKAASSQKFGDAVFSIASPKEIELMRTVYFNNAYNLVKKYVPQNTITVAFS